MGIHSCWLGVQTEYMCPSCCVTPVDKDTISSTTQDLFKLKEVINRQSRYCLYCRIFLNTVDALVALGFPDPQGRPDVYNP